jgi:subtilisin family serine protease
MPAVAAGQRIDQLESVADREVIVLIDSVAVGPVSYSADTAVAQLATASPNAALVSVLGSPSQARLAIQDRLPASLRSKLSANDPEEMLQRYVVLTFSTTSAAKNALLGLKHTTGIRYAGPNSMLRWSVTPNDPYYQVTFDPKTFQWGANNPLHLQEAWSLETGHAYIGHIDNGIQLGHPELDNTSAPWTTSFRSQLSKDFVAGSTSAIYFDGLNGVDEAGFRFFNQGTQQTVYLAGHGTHTAGIMTAAGNNGTGVAGVCWGCSLVVSKLYGPEDMFLDAIHWSLQAGVQVMNFSGSYGRPADGNHTCADNSGAPMCTGLALIVGRDVLFVAASGNMETVIDFPASEPTSVAVGGLQYHGYSATDMLWHEDIPFPYDDVVGTNTGPEQMFVAPARDVLSTVYTDRDWSYAARCGDSQLFNREGARPLNPPVWESGGNAGAGYGLCTGTSMAAPFITGIAAIIRSINPLWTRAQVLSFMQSTASNGGTRNSQSGYGAPNAGAAVAAALAATNRLTPLFAFYSVNGGDYLYSTVPQVGPPVIRGKFPPRVDSTLIYYTTVGTTINEYPQFPLYQFQGDEPPPRAQVWVFTTPTNPFNANAPLAPLYRMSWKCGDTPGYFQPCAVNPVHVEHAYATSVTEIQTFLSLGYKLDGLEGYIYPIGETRPANTSILYRGYKGAVYSGETSSDDDWAIYPDTEWSNMASQGFRTGVPLTGAIGYVYLNTGPRPTY